MSGGVRVEEAGVGWGREEKGVRKGEGEKEREREREREREKRQTDRQRERESESERERAHVLDNTYSMHTPMPWKIHHNFRNMATNDGFEKYTKQFNRQLIKRLSHLSEVNA